jgi:hypothetical protein
MSYPPSYEGSSSSSGDFDRPRYPLPLILLALMVGALLGALLSRRRKKPKDAVQAAREWLDAAYEQLAEKLPQLAEKLPQLAEKFPQSKPTALWCQAAFLDQARQAGKKLKWW